MGKKCAAVGCKTGYVSETRRRAENGEKITVHAFPLSDAELCAEWVEALGRKGFAPTTHSTICSLHFRDDDFVKESRDSNVSRKRGRGKETMKRRYLKKKAVPSLQSETATTTPPQSIHNSSVRTTDSQPMSVKSSSTEHQGDIERRDCIVSIRLYSASCSAHQSEALPVRETQREESS